MIKDFVIKKGELFVPDPVFRLPDGGHALTVILFFIFLCLLRVFIPLYFLNYVMALMIPSP